MIRIGTNSSLVSSLGLVLQGHGVNSLHIVIQVVLSTANLNIVLGAGSNLSKVQRNNLVVLHVLAELEGLRSALGQLGIGAGLEGQGRLLAIDDYIIAVEGIVAVLGLAGLAVSDHSILNIAAQSAVLDANEHIQIIAVLIGHGANLLLDFAFVNETVTAWGIAVVHSIFNLTATAVLLPFANGLEKLAILTIPDDAEKESFALLDERLLNTPAVAVERARAATADMAELARVGVVQAMSLTHKWDDSLAQKVREEEEKVDKYEDALGTYLVKLSSREMSHADSQSVNTLLHTISDFERISDHSVNVLSSAEEIHAKSIEFSKDAQEELQVLEGAVQDVLSRTTDAFRKGDLHMAGKVEPLETVVDELVRAIKARHVARLQTGSCSIEYGFVLEDLLTNYERVCDHCSNVAVAQIEVAQDSFDTHAYLNDLRYGNETKESEQFQRRLDRYRERYLFPDSDTAPADAKEEPNK